MKVNDICPHCHKGILELVLENYPWTTDHLQCNVCDSTYNLEDENNKQYFNENELSYMKSYRMTFTSNHNLWSSNQSAPREDYLTGEAAGQL